MPQQQPIAGRYELLEPLDNGGMRDEWRSYDAVLDRPVAVQLIRQQAVGGSPQLAEEFAKRFRREARITARIQHPGVPQAYETVLDDTYERLFLVMELVDGVSLSAYIHPDRPLPVSWAVAVAAQVATVLSYAHEVPVIHRDLKPSNILVARDGTVKVLDFGIAAILRTDVTKLTATGTPIGTYQYTAPEQVRGGRTTPQIDPYPHSCGQRSTGRTHTPTRSWTRNGSRRPPRCWERSSSRPHAHPVRRAGRSWSLHPACGDPGRHRPAPARIGPAGGTLPAVRRVHTGRGRDACLVVGYTERVPGGAGCLRPRRREGRAGNVAVSGLPVRQGRPSVRGCPGRR